MSSKVFIAYKEERVKELYFCYLSAPCSEQHCQDRIYGMWLCNQVLQNFLTETPISLEKYVIFTCCCLLCVWSSCLIAVSNTERRRNDRSSTIGKNDGDIHSYVNKHVCNNGHTMNSVFSKKQNKKTCCHVYILDKANKVFNMTGLVLFSVAAAEMYSLEYLQLTHMIFQSLTDLFDS